MSVINTNIKSLIAQNSLKLNNRSLQGAMEQLSTGKRINSAADDAAGLAISNKMTSQIRGLDQAIRNANDGISLLQTAEGATKEITNMLQRMRELAVQACNDTYSDADRTSLNLEIDELVAEIDRIGNNTMWNGMHVFAGEVGNGGEYAIQVGTGGGTDDTITGTLHSIDSLELGIDSLNIEDSANAADSLSTIDEAIILVDSYRADFGAKINRLTYAADNAANISMNTSASRSQIEDDDYAKASTDLARTQIMQQAATAVLAQANSDQQSVLKLLQN